MNEPAAPSVADGPLVDITDLHFRYGTRPILSGVTMQFGRGKVIAVMGGSGSGKTTILRLIGGQLTAESGRVRVAGQDIATLDRHGLYAVRRRMGMLFQFGALFTDMSVFDNVAFPLREHTDLSEELIRDLVLMKLNAVGLRGAHELMPGEISGGMARRVALARAIALDPELILYDEPFAGLDPISLGVTANLIRSLTQALGATSVLVTHDVAESLAIADYVYFIASGKVAAEGTPDELAKSTDPFVRQFVDGAPDGPVPFHYPAPSYASDLGFSGSAR
jgi:phospholipid/cholesterol/gamma-HCH transport system ATP-binding protein